MDETPYKDTKALWSKLANLGNLPGKRTQPKWEVSDRKWDGSQLFSNVYLNYSQVNEQDGRYKLMRTL